MESRVNYIIVGVFVVLFSTALIAFAFWLGKYGDDSDFVYYKAYMTESVSGLSREASVKYRGVDVGIVTEVKIDPNNSEQVQLTLKVRKDTPIRKDMYVILKFYGLTGLAFIEISGGSKSAALFTHDDGEMPTISTAPSLYQRLDESLSGLAGKLTHTLDSMDELLNKKNIENFSDSLSNIKDFSIQIKSFQKDVRAVLKKGVGMEESIIAASNQVAEASVGIKEMVSALEESVKRGDFDIKQIGARSFEKFDGLMENLNSLSSEIEQAVISIKDSPSDLLFKQTEKKLGPGERSQ